MWGIPEPSECRATNEKDLKIQSLSSSSIQQISALEIMSLKHSDIKSFVELMALEELQIDSFSKQLRPTPSLSLFRSLVEPFKPQIALGSFGMNLVKSENAKYLILTHALQVVMLSRSPFTQRQGTLLLALSAMYVQLKSYFVEITNQI